MNAELRLLVLEDSFPEFLQRFPQHVIASYLGMTEETHSEIRYTNYMKWVSGKRLITC
jgi:hypothetical protein